MVYESLELQGSRLSPAGLEEVGFNRAVSLMKPLPSEDPQPDRTDSFFPEWMHVVRCVLSNGFMETPDAIAGVPGRTEDLAVRLAQDHNSSFILTKADRINPGAFKAMISGLPEKALVLGIDPDNVETTNAVARSVVESCALEAARRLELVKQSKNGRVLDVGHYALDIAVLQTWVSRTDKGDWDKPQALVWPYQHLKLDPDTMAIDEAECWFTDIS